MALPECWRDLDEAVGLRQAMSAAKAVLNEKGDIRMKQKEVQQLLTDSGINLEFFECVFGELEDQMEDTELESYLEVWAVEVDMAAVDAQKAITTICQTNGFQIADIDVVGAYVMSRLAVTKQKRKISEAAPDIGDEASAVQSNELSSLEDAMEINVQNVHKAKRARQLASRKNMLLSPQKSSKTSEQASPSRASNDCKQEVNGEDTQASTLAAHSSEPTLATDSSQENMLVMAVPTSPQASVNNVVSSTVLVSQVVNSMMQDAEVCVKVFYTPHGVSNIPSNYSSGPLKIYETRVGAEGKEYTLVAKGDAATHAASELEQFGQQVVKLRHVKHAHYKNQDQLEVMENMEVDQCVDSDEVRNLTQLSLKRYTLQQLLEYKSSDKPRFSLQMCCVQVDSESKLDKNGSPYRSTRVHDAAGSVTMVMVWGGLAANDDVWKRDAVIDIFAAEVHFAEKRLNIRNFSQVNLVPRTTSFRKPAKLTFLKWE